MESCKIFTEQNCNEEDTKKDASVLNCNILEESKNETKTRDTYDKFDISDSVVVNNCDSTEECNESIGITEAVEKENCLIELDHNQGSIPLANTICEAEDQPTNNIKFDISTVDDSSQENYEKNISENVISCEMDIDISKSDSVESPTKHICENVNSSGMDIDVFKLGSIESLKKKSEDINSSEVDIAISQSIESCKKDIFEDINSSEMDIVISQSVGLSKNTSDDINSTEMDIVISQSIESSEKNLSEDINSLEMDIDIVSQSVENCEQKIGDVENSEVDIDVTPSSSADIPDGQGADDSLCSNITNQDLCGSDCYLSNTLNVCDSSYDVDDSATICKDKCTENEASSVGTENLTKDRMSFSSTSPGYIPSNEMEMQHLASNSLETKAANLSLSSDGNNSSDVKSLPEINPLESEMNCKSINIQKDCGTNKANENKLNLTGSSQDNCEQHSYTEMPKNVTSEAVDKIENKMDNQYQTEPDNLSFDNTEAEVTEEISETVLSDGNSTESTVHVSSSTNVDVADSQNVDKIDMSPKTPASNNTQQDIETDCHLKVVGSSSPDDNRKTSSLLQAKGGTSTYPNTTTHDNVELNVLSTTSAGDISTEKINSNSSEVELLEIDNSQDEAVDLTQPQDRENCAAAQSQDVDLSESSFAGEDKSVGSTSGSSTITLSIPLNKKETGFPNAFEGLVSIGKYVSVKGDFTLRSSEALIESPSLVAPFLLKEPDTFPEHEQDPKPEDRGFFNSSIGEFLVGLGLSRVNEWYYRDVVHIKNKQMRKEGKLPHLEHDFKIHQSNYTQAKLANEPYSFPNKTCSLCKFVTESDIVLEGHLLTPHVTSRREYQCSYCLQLYRDVKEILKHMKVVHNKIGCIQLPSFLYECPHCIFQCNSKAKIGTHVNKCSKYYDRYSNQSPSRDFEFPCLTPKPITVAVVKAYEKSLNVMQNRYKKFKKGENMLDSFQHHLSDNPHMHIPYESASNMSFSDSITPSAGISRKATRPIRPQFANSGSNLPQFQYPSSNRFFQMVNSGGTVVPVMPSDPAVSSPLQFSFLSNITSQKGTTNQSFKGMFPPGLPQPPKLQGPYPVQVDKSMPSLSSPHQPNSLVVCEICDGYIKDMEQLRTHMQLIHKVKIHPKVLSSRPPLNCQKCQWRFFTDQGLERHLLGIHGLVTSNMQELANKGKDAGCCTICGRVFASKLVAHMNQVHKTTLKPAHLSYKCTVCSATFNLYRLFENHVYLVHSGASKRPADSCDLPSKKIRGSNWDPIQSGNRDKHLRNFAEKENGTT